MLESYTNEEQPLEIRLETTGQSNKLYRRVQVKEEQEGAPVVQYIKTTVGRVLFNQVVIDSLVPRSH